MNVGNVVALSSRRSSGEENEEIHEGPSSTKSEDDVKPQGFRFELNDGPIKFDFTHSKKENHAPATSLFAPPVKSSPLKRSDGIMNLDHANFGSPVAKRRSVHAGSSGSDFDIFEQASMYGHTETFQALTQDQEPSSFSFSSPGPRKASPPRKPLSLRKSTLQQRYGTGTPRSKVVSDHGHEFAVPGLAASKSRPRMSLDSSLPVMGQATQSPFHRSNPDPIITSFSPSPLPHRPGPTPHQRSQPHPLSNAVTSSASASPLLDEPHPPAPTTTRPSAPKSENIRPPMGFSRSLPIGAGRPAALREMANEGSSDSASFATPEAYKMAKPLPAAFMSTGLISKRNRNVDVPPAGSFAGYAMPDTPSKRVSFPPMTSSPFHRSVLAGPTQPRHEFGTPSTPFSSHATKVSPETFGKGVSIFGTRFGGSGLPRRGSFASIDGDENPHSPSGGHMDTQSSNDELPPTPTKPNGGNGRRSKENSLRSSLLGRRTSLGPDTFTPLTTANGPSPQQNRKSTPVNSMSSSGRLSPHTPQDSFMPPDPSSLSISGRDDCPASISFNSSLGSFPPATPTGPRDQPFPFGNGQPAIAPFAGLTQNDVDTSLTARFGSVNLYGNGEFSQVYRVEKAINAVQPQSSSSLPSAASVWAVKKTKRPYAGNKDRERKMREVRILETLRGHDHVIQLVDSWESKNHLYIQTVFCENGNLKDFLTQAGYKARLDDFRIWKILLELSHGLKFIHDSGFIHLDLKPANVFIDWEGVLKIGDFGLASPWPAPRDIDGEGDREYIGPEVLSGRFDKPADIFALGMIMLEIAGNIILPDNGASWQRLRSGDMSDLPSLTWSSENSLVRDESGDPVNDLFINGSKDTLFSSENEDNEFKFLRSLAPNPIRREELANPPNFMVDPDDSEALDKLVQWMISPTPDHRPVIDQVYHSGGVQWVERRRRAGATIYEGNWGPADEVLNHHGDVDMVDAS